MKYNSNMFVRELYIMAVVNNSYIKSFIIKNVFSYKEIYYYFENYYKKKKVTLCYDCDIHLYDDNLWDIINWEHDSLFLRIFY